MNQNTLRPDLSSLETKAKFFAQYFNQTVLYNTAIDHLMVLNATTLDDHHDGDCLELTPLSDITDEDKRSVLGIHYRACAPFSFSNAEYIVRNMASVDLRMSQTLDIIDFLRSKSYALPWMGYSVNELIEAGYLVLKEGEDHE